MDRYVELMTLNYRDALGILKEVEATTDASLRKQMVELAIRYARLRVDCHQAGLAGDAMLEATRTRAHNALIDSLNILSRDAVNSEQPIHWRDRLGDDRKVIGDFACHLHAILGLRAR